MNQADLAVIYKKGKTEQPENYRPIALLNIGYKLMASMIQKRLAEAMDDRIDPAQFGFRKSRSTSQPIHIYRRIQEIHEEAGLELVTILLDWEKAFDKIHQGRLLDALKRTGIPMKRNGQNIVRKKTELGDQTRMPTISLPLYNSHDCNDERYKL